MDIQAFFDRPKKKKEKRILMGIIPDPFISRQDKEQALKKLKELEKGETK